MLVCAFMIYPPFTSGLADGTLTTVFGMPITQATYTSSVLPAILVTWVLSYVDKYVNKFIPKILSTSFAPLVTLLIMTPLAITVLGPSGVIVGNYMSAALMWIYDTFGFVGMAVMGALRPLLVFTGMHSLFKPIWLNSFMTLCYETFFLVNGLSYSFAAVGACYAVALKAKKKEIKTSAITCGTTGLIGGITEPALYGILFKYKKPLIAVMIASGIASAYMGLTNTFCYAMPGSVGIFMLPCFIGPESSNFINAIIGACISVVVAFVITYRLGIDENA